MTLSYNTYSGNGSSTTFGITFPYILQEHVEVRVNGTPVTYTWINNSTVSIVPAPASGAVVDIRRNTPKNVRLVDFVDASTLLESDLDLDSMQALYAAQEAQDAVDLAIRVGSDQKIDAQNRVIKNVADPVDPADAANRQWVLQQASTPGPVGPVGPVGPAGPVGPVGPQGPLGPTGVQGQQGPVGPTGPQGPEGPQGPQGVQGPQGIQGQSFTPNIVAASSLRSTYDAQTQGFSFLAIDLGAISFKASNTSGDWSPWVPFGVGPAGPVGVQGPQGIQGVQGIQGPAGPVGPKGLTFRGGYDAGTAYLADDVVVNQNSSWVAKTSTTGNAPPTLPNIENTHWSILASGGSASGVSFTPSGGLVATTVQAAIEEVVSDTAALLAGKADAAATTTALAGKSNTGHGHAITDVTDLRTSLDLRTAYRNRIVNPAMQISQERGTAHVDVTSGGVYTVDQWSASLSATPGGTLRVQQIATATPSGSPFRLRHTVQVVDTSIAAGDQYGTVHNIEGVMFADARFGTASARQLLLRMGVRSSIAGTFGVRLTNTGAGRSYVTTITIAAGEVNTDVVRTFVIPGDTTGTWLTDTGLGIQLRVSLAAGTTFHTATANSWQAGNVVTTSAQTNFMGTAGATFDLFDVGLYVDHLGTGVAPQFEVPAFDAELRACQRYWEFMSSVECLMSIDVVASTSYSFGFPFRVIKRTAAPAVALTNNMAGFNAPTLSSTSTSGLRVNATSTGTAASRAFSFSATVNDRL
jgi:hypothetical protein